MDDQTREAIDGTGDHEQISEDLEYGVYGGGTSRSDTIGTSTLASTPTRKRARTATSTMGSRICADSTPSTPIKTRHSSAGPDQRCRGRELRRHVRAVIGLIFAIELVVLAIWASLAWALDAIGRRPHSRATFDAIIVPGCAVLSNGMPSCARPTNPVSGPPPARRAGQHLGAHGRVDRFPPAESEAATWPYSELGVEPDAIRVETRSTTTAENARFAADLFDAPDTLHVLVVSDAYHCFRCRRLFARHFGGVETAGSTPGPRLRVRAAHA